MRSPQHNEVHNLSSSLKDLCGRRSAKATVAGDRSHRLQTKLSRRLDKRRSKLPVMEKTTFYLPMRKVRRIIYGNDLGLKGGSGSNFQSWYEAGIYLWISMISGTDVSPYRLHTNHKQANSTNTFRSDFMCILKRTPSIF